MSQDPSRTFLVISAVAETPWISALQRALSSLGELHILPEGQAVAAIERSDYDLVLVDAGMVDNAALLVARLRARSDRARVLVFSSAPTWRRARELLLAGAMDYVRKTLDEEEMRYLIESILGLPSSGGG